MYNLFPPRKLGADMVNLCIICVAETTLDPPQDPYFELVFLSEPIRTYLYGRCHFQSFNVVLSFIAHMRLS